ncbi:scaffolding protein [Bacillus sp. JJ1566]|uniref:scaffolding protein n=1 Tax=Bacillus sp. JJ1566 TaxID=3122961 RepID=UPI002FFF3566
MKKIVSYIRALLASIWLLFATEKKKEEQKKFIPFQRLNLQFFAGDGGDGGDGGEGGSGAGGAGAGEDEPFATFKTQDDLNKRLGRAEKKGQKELAQKLGFDSVEAMQEALKKSESPAGTGQGQGNGSNQVDVDAVVEAKLKEQLKAEQDKTFKRLVNAEVKVQANELGFADWEDALALADLTQVKEDEKGNIVGVKEALEALKTKKPHLLKQQGSNGGFGASIPNNPPNQKEQLESIKKLASSRGVQQTQTHNPWA